CDRIRNVRRVEPAAEADLEHRGAHLVLREREEREDGRHLEEGERDAGALGCASHPLDALCDALARDLRAADADPFGEVHEVRRGVEARDDAGFAQDGVHHRRGGALPVRARDEHRRIALLRRADGGERRADALELQVPAERHLERVEVGDRVLVRHRNPLRPSYPDAGVRVRTRSRRPRVERRSRRWTTASSMPCSSTDSARWNPAGSVWWIVCSITRGPAKPMSAPGSASWTSPRMASEAATPPVVGSVRTQT